MCTFPEGYEGEALRFAAFMDDHPTIFHFTEGIKSVLSAHGFSELVERDIPHIRRGGRYFIVRNGSSLVAFVVGKELVVGPDGFNVVGSHIDANRLLLKPTSLATGPLGFLRLGVAPYAGGLNETWWDRDLGLGGRLVVRKNGAVFTKLVRLPGVVGSVPSLAPHFGVEERNLETNAVPVVSLETKVDPTDEERASPLYNKHPLALLRALAREANCKIGEILEADLEMFSAEKAAIGGLDGEFLYCSRMDDKLCSYAAIKGLLQAEPNDHSVQAVALFDNEEIGSLTRQGAQSNLLDVAMTVVYDSLGATKEERRQAAANSYVVSADVTHAGNPNYLGAYLENHIPLLNVGMTVKRLGRFVGFGEDTALAERVSQRAGQQLQTFAPRNDTSSGGTIGPFITTNTGFRGIDVGIPILSMHSIRETTGTRDVGLGVEWFAAFFASQYNA